MLAYGAWDVYCVPFDDACPLSILSIRMRTWLYAEELSSAGEVGASESCDGSAMLVEQKWLLSQVDAKLRELTASRELRKYTAGVNRASRSAKSVALVVALLGSLVGIIILSTLVQREQAVSLP